MCSRAAGQLSCTKHRTLLLPTAPSAGFHNASLYPALRPAVPPLVALLRDEEDRTRANAAGALGNLVRNSGMLCRDIREAGALEVRASVHDGGSGAGAAQELLLPALLAAPVVQTVMWVFLPASTH